MHTGRRPEEERDDGAFLLSVGLEFFNERAVEGDEGCDSTIPAPGASIEDLVRPSDEGEKEGGFSPAAGTMPISTLSWRVVMRAARVCKVIEKDK